MKYLLWTSYFLQFEVDSLQVRAVSRQLRIVFRKQTALKNHFRLIMNIWLVYWGTTNNGKLHPTSQDGVSRYVQYITLFINFIWKIKVRYFHDFYFYFTIIYLVSNQFIKSGSTEFFQTYLLLHFVKKFWVRMVHIVKKYFAVCHIYYPNPRLWSAGTS